MPLKVNIGFFKRRSTAYGAVLVLIRAIGLVPNAHDPCFYTGFVRDPHDSSSSASTVPLSSGLYIDDFIYFSEDPATEALFEHLLREWVNVDFMGFSRMVFGYSFFVALHII